VPAKQASEGMIKYLKIMNGRLSVRDPFIFFERDTTKLQASVEQADHGQITHLRIAANGDIYAIGQQLSYKVMLAPLKDGFSLHTQALPILYGKHCGPIWKQLFSPCPEALAIYSNALSAIFISGYNSNGRFASYVYGLAKKPIDLSSHPTPNYQSDCKEGFARLVGPSGASLMNVSGDLKPLSQ
jgi:hypothetical protein